MPEQRKPSDTGIEDAHVETHTKSTVETIALELETLGQENAQLFEDVQALQKRIDELLNDAETMKTLASVDPALKARLGRASGAVLRIFPEIAAQRSESKKIRDQEKQFQQYSLKAETVIGNEKAAKLTELFSTKDPTLQERIINGLKSALNEKNSAGQKAKLEGLLFEVSRLDILHSQGLEQVYVGQPPAMDITYEARNGKRVTKAPVLPDAFIQREDGLYAYEAKFLPRMPYGSTDGHHDQIAKYQAAIEQKKITGATVELRGRIDPNFLKYVCGSGIEDPGPVPDVEIIYTLPLPSGAEYRFPLKRIQTMNGLKFANEDKRYTPEDHHIIAGVQRALQDRTIIEIISSPQVSTPELQPFLADPMKIPTSELYDTFQQEVLANVHQRLLDKRSVINHDNRQNARNPEFATVEMTQTIVLDALKTFQLFLRDNPHMAKAKAAYIVKPENWQAVTELATKHIQTVRKHEEVRQASADEQLRQAERKQLGYYARPEGIALDLDHFLLDAIQEVNAEVENTELQKNKKGKIKETDLRRGRNYDHPERFRRAEDLKNYLATQDRFYREAQVLDPLKKTEDGIAKTEVFSSRLENLESDILKINIQRAEVLLLLPTLRSELAQLSLQTEASPTNTRHRSELQKQVATLEGLSRELQLLPLEDQLHTLPEDAVAARSVIQKRIKSLPISLPHIQKTTDAISELRIEKTRVIEAEKNPQQKRQIASEFDERIKENMKQLVQYYKQAMGGEQEWGKFARRTTRIIEQNRIKFIYVVKADGTILTDEEKLRGVAVTGRAAHSELAQGENIYGGGELAFDKQDDGSWNLVEINNGSGHFRPDSSTLFYVKNVLEKKGINTSHAILRDSLQRGASPPDLSLSE